jgi:hypothetical protein
VALYHSSQFKSTWCILTACLQHCTSGQAYLPIILEAVMYVHASKEKEPHIAIINVHQCNQSWHITLFHGNFFVVLWYYTMTRCKIK